MNTVCFGGILLPKEGTDFTKWSVVACDQYTSEPDYWKSIEEWVGDSPSTLRLICPECWLGEIGERESGIRRCSEEYVKNVLAPAAGAVLVKRTVGGLVRTGIVCSIDLEKYNYEPNAGAPIRATERTVPERIPARMRVKAASRVDVPHVLCLIDDSRHPLKNAVKTGKRLYSFDLNGNGGHIEGFEIADLKALGDCFNAIEEEAALKGDPFILVGDGNHSLASAKAYYLDLKAKGDKRAAKARYALVEIISVFDEGIVFGPINRVLFSTGALDTVKKALSVGVPARAFAGNEEITLYLPADPVEAYKKVTALFDEISSETGAKVDYIHGLDSLINVSRQGGIGILMPSLEKKTFFKLVSREGILPKKTFSLGEANEKRYYLECRDLGSKY